MKRKLGGRPLDSGVIDWGEDFRGYKRSSEDCVPIDVGDNMTWADRCSWGKATGRRCSLVAGVQGLCGWHYDCLNVGGKFSEDKKAFSEWLNENYPKANTIEIFPLVTGQFDPYIEMRFDAELGKPGPTKSQKYESGYGSEGRAISGVILRWLTHKNNKKSQEEMAGLSEIFSKSTDGFIELAKTIGEFRR